MNNIKRQYVPIEAKRLEWGLRKLKTKSLLKTLTITMLLAVIVGMPLLAIYRPSIWLLPAGAILLGIIVVYSVLSAMFQQNSTFQTNDNEDVYGWVDGYRYDYSYNPNPKHED